MTADEMTPELRANLQERMRHRADRLARIAALPSCPLPVIALMAEHVTATAMLLCGEDMARRMFNRVVSGLRDGHGICVCGNALTHGLPLCAGCEKEMADVDKEMDQVAAMYRPIKGQPS